MTRRIPKDIPDVCLPGWKKTTKPNEIEEALDLLVEFANKENMACKFDATPHRVYPSPTKPKSNTKGRPSVYLFVDTDDPEAIKTLRRLGGMDKGTPEYNGTAHPGWKIDNEELCAIWPRLDLKLRGRKANKHAKYRWEFVNSNVHAWRMATRR